MQERNLQCKFLLFTRSKSFDYKWVFTTNDSNLLDFLDQYKPVSDDLVEYPLPCTVFFTNSDYCVLKIADVSPKKRDVGGRPITHRGYFIWSNNDISKTWLTYNNLISVSKLLEKTIHEQYSDPTIIPDNDVNPKTFKDITIEIKESNFSEFTTNSIKEIFLPNSIETARIAEIIVPKTWKFNEMSSLLGNNKINEIKFFIWNGKVNESIKPPSQNGWILNSSNEKTDYIYLKDEKGSVLKEIDIKDDVIKLTEENIVSENNVHKNLTNLDDLIYSTSKDEKKSQIDSETPTPIIEYNDLSEKIAPDYVKVTQTDQPWEEKPVISAYNTPVRNAQKAAHNTKQIKMVYEIEQISVFIQNLISPYNSNFSLLYFFWTNSIFEIHRIFLDTKTSEKIKNELKKVMANRIDCLKDITTDSLKNYTNSDWNEQFDKACRRFKVLLLKDTYD